MPECLEYPGILDIGMLYNYIPFRYERADCTYHYITEKDAYCKFYLCFCNVLSNVKVFLCLHQSGEDDVSQFDSKFTKQTPVDSPDDHMLSESANMVFEVRTELILFLFILFIIVSKETQSLNKKQRENQRQFWICLCVDVEGMDGGK